MNAQRLIVNDSDIACLRRLDPIFDQIHLAYGPPPNWARQPGFMSLCKIILEQQVSLASGKAHFLKLEGYIGEISPKAILELTDDEMRQCQISRQKSTYLKELSKWIATGRLDLDGLSHLPESEVRTQLTSIKGIGQWTSDIYLMFCLQSPDILPLGDIAIINTIRELFPTASKENIQALSANWRPLRTLSSFYLWHYYLQSRNRPAIT